MAINRRIELIDFSEKNSELLQVVYQHQNNATITRINAEFHNDYLIVAFPELEDLLSAINQRIRKLQIIHYSYFGDLSENALAGSAASLPFEANYQFHYNTNSFSSNISFNTAVFYREVIDNQFQTFILTAAAIFENIVRLVEKLTKKVVLHHTNRKPPSVPLGMYLNYLDSLLRLNYRNVNPFVQCLLNHESFLRTYVETVNFLRNSYIHGYKSNLVLNSGRYMISKLEAPLTSTTPQAEAKFFTEDFTEGMIEFFTELLETLIAEVSTSADLPF
ncbi:hypothetical protein PF438_14715 [Elizabethkingia meningoseptica]|uniref:hypothetical protein n=1 Tax=Elizabethkingia meningoseptica TaxID=238 RepID=UPI0022F17F98|nr:hypothetical protein [Elizabethkingia meningoseptica]EJK5328093.1 hypothetical protein [Elizabethkingia meningoseptica]WBS74144.1 hypothetical protein PF438_14715 [Elizabethkingia meningoseptica]